MSGSRWFASPLAGTAGVLLGLGLLAIPLRKLTSAPKIPVVVAVTPAPAAKEIPAVLRLRLLAMAQRVSVKTADGQILLELENQAAGESEHDAVIPFDEARTELTLEADFGGATGETAVFLTVMPDGYEDQTRHMIGTGLITEPLQYEWHTH